jgi:DNA-binding NtrC family response regulator
LKRVLLIDHHDARRATRVYLLQGAGYEVTTADRFELVEGRIREAGFDLVIVETDNVMRDSIAYGQRLRLINPQLPILLLSEAGLFFPKDVVLSSFSAGQPSPLEVMTKIAALLLASTHLREDAT